MASTTSTDSSLMSKRLLGKVALVTGGANGIGESIVRTFLKHGAKVCIVDIQDETGHRLYESLRHDGDVTYIHCNVAIEDEVKEAVDHAVDTFGTLDIMVNNAAQMEPRCREIRDFQVSKFEQVLNVNAKGVFSGMKHAARIMIPAKKGVIISTCSIAGVMGGLGPHAYTGSKHAVLGLTRSVAAELGRHGIRVNCVSPYVIPTNLVAAFQDLDVIPAVRNSLVDCANLKGVELTTQDIANAVLFLASDEARYISAANLVVDGGFTSVSNSFQIFD